MPGWLRLLANRDEAEGALGRHAFLLASLVVLLVALPLLDMLAGGATRFALLIVPVLAAAIWVNSHQRVLFTVAVLCGVVAIGALVASIVIDSTALRILSHALSLALLGWTTLVLLNSLIQSDVVSQDTLVGGICVYLLVGLCFAMVFILMTELMPGAFVADGEAIVRSGSDTSAHATQLLYFSFVTLTTLGFGDVAPATEIAQMAAVAEALFGQLYLTIFLARLVAIFVAAARTR